MAVRPPKKKRPTQPVYSRPTGTDASANVRIDNKTAEEQMNIRMAHGALGRGLQAKNRQELIQSEANRIAAINKQEDKPVENVPTQPTQPIQPLPAQAVANQNQRSQPVAGSQPAGEQISNAEYTANKDIDSLLNFVADPLAGASSAANEIVNQTPEGTLRLAVNTRVADIIEKNRVVAKKTGSVLIDQIWGRAFGRQKNLKQELSSQKQILADSLAALNSINEAMASGIADPVQSEQDFQFLIGQIYQAESKVYAIASNSADAQVSGVVDNIAEFEIARRTLPNIQKRFDLLRDAQQQATALGEFGL